MKVPINPIVEMAMNKPIEKGSISWKIQQLSKLYNEFRRLETFFETENEPTEYIKTKMISVIEKIEEYQKDIDEWKKNCPYELKSL